MQVVKIPSERLNALMGDSGETKDYLEGRMNVSLSVDSEGAVEINGESLEEYIAKDVVKAIGRGFEPQVALRLLSDEYGFKVIDLRDFSSSNKDIARIKGRVIGEHGRTKEIIKEEVGSDVAIYGHTIAIISKLDTLDYGLTAIFKLIEGANHSTVYAYLEKCRRKIKEGEVRKLLG
jgi:ribosomal RNA assembly protein